MREPPKQMKQFVLFYLLPYSIVLLAMVVLLCLYPQKQLHLMLNGYHCLVLDAFFRLYTHLAEWPLYLVALVGLYWKRTCIFTFVYAASEVCGTVVVQLLKHLFHQPRPVIVFGKHLSQLTLVPGVHLHQSNSFPSGHTSTFFIFFTCSAFFFLLYVYRSRERKPPVSIACKGMVLLLMFLAVLGGYSRIYLSQHFMLDVCVGSLSGVLIPSLICYCFRERLNRSLSAS